MPYNKARAEKEWLAWKTAEETKLRELGVEEETIQRLHTYDWMEFNRERRYLQRWAEWPAKQEPEFSEGITLPLNNRHALLNEINDESLLKILMQEDALTVDLILWKALGYSTEQICRYFHLSKYAYYNRIRRLKEKIKNFL